MSWIHDFLQPFITPYLDIFLPWLGDDIYQKLLLSLYQNHPLVRLNGLLDLTALEMACADFSSGLSAIHWSV